MANGSVRDALIGHYRRVPGIFAYGIVMIVWIAVLPRGEDGATETLPLILTGYPLLLLAVVTLRTRFAQHPAVRLFLWAIIGTGGLMTVLLIFALIDGKSGL